MKEYQCKLCGETNPAEFHITNKSKCKKCLSTKYKQNYNSVPRLMHSVVLKNSCGDIIETYNLVDDVSKKYGVDSNCVRNWIQQKRISKKGNYFEYGQKSLQHASQNVIRKIIVEKNRRKEFKTINTVHRINKEQKIKRIICEEYSHKYDYVEIVNYNDIIKKWKVKLFNKVINKEMIVSVEIIYSKSLSKNVKKMASYNEAKERVNKLGINSHSEYRQWKKRTCQDDLPSNPERVYCGKGWVDYYEFFDNRKYDTMSNGEKRIYNYLKRKKIDYVWQKKFEDCRNRFQLPFDFYLPFYNVAIEFDGQQHFKAGNFASTPEENQRIFERQQKNDKIKTRYCQDKGITLIRLDIYHLNKNIIEWELDNELVRIAAEIAIENI